MKRHSFYEFSILLYIMLLLESIEFLSSCLLIKPFNLFKHIYPIKNSFLFMTQLFQMHILYKKKLIFLSLSNAILSDFT